MKVILSNSFKCKLKKLDKKHKIFILDCMDTIIEKPKSGNKKTGDIYYLFVYKKSYLKKQVFIAYFFDKKVVKFYAFGVNKNFYTDLKTK